MDFSFIKVMIYINKLGRISKSDLENNFQINSNEAHEILNTLYKNGYITYYSDGYRPTYKGKHIISSAILSFININFIDILALIVAIIALIISIIK